MGARRASLLIDLGMVAILVGACGGAVVTTAPAATPGPTARPHPDAITMQAPAEAAPGERITVSWTGKEQLGDGIYIVEAGRTRIFATDDAAGYNTSLGNPGTLVAPAKPGAYEIWFVEEETVDHIKARLPLTVR
jgi:hypothetical protein